jgi:tRNA dimethylallyltransferase
MDVGTAKPSAAELAAVPHHLINIRDPLQAYSAAEFVTDATALIQAISARGKLPLLVGGTMMYFKALMDGIDPMPAANASIRADIDAQAQEKGWPAMHAELAQVDPVTAARLAPADSQRIQRALEVFRISGLPLSHFHARQSLAYDGADSGPLISLEPLDRAWLHARIAQRFDQMLAAGLVEEVQTLRARGDLHPDLPSMRCVGYRQAWEALDAVDAGMPLDQAMRSLRERGIIASRQLAKRQLTWLRGMPERQVLACDSPSVVADVLAALALLSA